MRHYRTPKLVQSSRGLYVEYYYLIPEDVWYLFGNKKWKRFRIKEDMNRRKGEDQQQYAKWLLNEINEMLKSGYSPFSSIETIQSEAKKQAATMRLKCLLKRGVSVALKLLAWRSINGL